MQDMKDVLSDWLKPTHGHFCDYYLCFRLHCLHFLFGLHSWALGLSGHAIPLHLPLR
uniref:Uncharacterized protein n=1 Tax=Anguilla anguilla TaxID=7936 RepID=A0A0E9WWG9_ANGAN